MGTLVLERIINLPRHLATAARTVRAGFNRFPRAVRGADFHGNDATVGLLPKLERNVVGAVNGAAILGHRIGVVVTLPAFLWCDVAESVACVPGVTPPWNLYVPSGSEVRRRNFLGLKRSPQYQKQRRGRGGGGQAYIRGGRNSPFLDDTDRPATAWHGVRRLC